VRAVTNDEIRLLANMTPLLIAVIGDRSNFLFDLYRCFPSRTRTSKPAEINLLTEADSPGQPGSSARNPFHTEKNFFRLASGNTVEGADNQNNCCQYVYGFMSNRYVGDKQE
jgi:hypothetical protein